ncbi:MAG: tRNA (guanosine(46)-N7)-methyltransferase TrmB, partial [Bacteroidales bacterium]|nr:tRNA (guanosine(46)-N7)-methyltransferase TrmB [Bacteroidales bacterium]
NLKTDSDILYEFTRDVIKESNFPLVYNYNDLYSNDDDLEVKSIRTYYEEMWLKQGLTIKYLKFQI